MVGLPTITCPALAFSLSCTQKTSTVIASETTVNLSGVWIVQDAVGARAAGQSLAAEMRKEGYAKLSLDPLHLLADRRLRATDKLGCPGEATQPFGSDEGAQDI